MTVPTVPLSFNLPLNDYQKRILNNPYRESGLERAYYYMKENPHKGLEALVLSQNLNENLKAYGIAGYAEAVVGVYGGAIGGAVLCDAAVAGAFVGAAGGIIAGLVIFEGIVVVNNIKNIQQSPHYQAWKLQHTKLVEDATISFFIKNDSIMRHLLCPITKKIPRIPVSVGQDVRTYDFKAAQEWIKNHPNTPLPGYSTLVKITDLTFDYAHINSVIERLQCLQEIVSDIKLKKICDFLGIKAEFPSDTPVQNTSNPPQEAFSETKIIPVTSSKSTLCKVGGIPGIKIIGKNHENEDHIKNLLFLIDFMTKGKFAELDLNKSETMKKSFMHIERIYSHIRLIEIKPRNIRINKYWKDLNALNNSIPKETKEEEALKKIETFRAECSYVKTIRKIEVPVVSFFLELIDWNVIITREVNLAFHPDIWAHNKPFSLTSCA